MSFRARLFLFFVIIVVVPMIAVALVLFSLTKDSETGKADAQIAQGLRVAFGEYSDSRAQARARRSAGVARDPALGAGAALGRRRGAARRACARCPPLRRRRDRGLRHERPRCSPAPATRARSPRGRPPRHRGRRAARVAGACRPRARDAYARRVARLAGLDVRVATPGPAAGLDDRRARPRRRSSRAPSRSRATTTAAASPSSTRRSARRCGSARSCPGGDIQAAVDDSRVLIGAILAAFLLLALLSSVVVVRALQRQIEQFLAAARRLAAGDFSRPVPVEGGDEFAALGTEFNRDVAAARGEDRGGPAQAHRARGHDPPRRRARSRRASTARASSTWPCARRSTPARPTPAAPCRSTSAACARCTSGDQAPDLSAALEAAERAAFDVRADVGGRPARATSSRRDEDPPPPVAAGARRGRRRARAGRPAGRAARAAAARSSTSA